MSIEDLISGTTIVIPVRDDPALLGCLASIDETTQIHVVCNGSTPDYVAWVRRNARERTTVMVRSDPGIGPAYNQGIEGATTPYVLLMDSDCVFSPGTIRAIVAGLAKAPMSKGRVRFNAGSSSETRLTANAREVLEDPAYTGVVKAYSPPLAYQKAVVGQMGGYHFHDGLRWREDREFELRRRDAGVPIVYNEDATITHGALTVREDLRSVLAYGVYESLGRRRGWLPKESGRSRLRKTVRTLVRIVRQTRSPMLVGYFLLRRFAFSIGRIEGRFS